MPSSDSPINDEATALPRLSSIPLESLVSSADGVLNKAVARFLREVTHGRPDYACHSSSPAAGSSEPNGFSGLVDVSAQPLAELMKDDRSAFQNSLRRVREAASNRAEKYAAFSNAP